MKAISTASCAEPGLTDARARLLSTMVERVADGRDLDADDLDGSVAALDERYVALTAEASQLSLGFES